MKKYSLQQGFTLVELLVSLALFTVVVVAAIGSLYTVNEASHRVNAMRTVLDNINFATESMSRTIRTAQNIVCGGVANGTSSADCPFGNNNGPSHAISLLSTIDNQSIEYIWQNNAVTGNGEIDKCIVVNGNISSGQCVAITAPEVNISSFNLYVNGADAGDGHQPSVVLMMQGVAKAGVNNTTPFAIQTFLSQRAAK